MTAAGADRDARARAASCFVIATRDRPGELVGAVRSLVAQTVLPAELCVVDASEEARARAEVERLCAEAGVALEYVHPAPPGLPRQRNLGIARTSGDPVFLIDDDVRMEPDAHEEVLAEYERAGPEVGGIRGVVPEPPQQGRASVLWRRLFGMGGWWAEASGRVRASFFAETIGSSADVRRVEAFTGWFMSFRREVFEHERFDENLGGYAFREDADFSYRVVKRGYVLLQTPRARVAHLKTDVARLAPFDLQRMYVLNQLYLHRKNMPQTLRYRAALWWALLGYLVLYAGKAVQTRNRGYVTGTLAGLWAGARGRDLPGARPPGGDVRRD